MSLALLTMAPVSFDRLVTISSNYSAEGAGGISAFCTSNIVLGNSFGLSYKADAGGSYGTGSASASGSGSGNGATGGGGGAAGSDGESGDEGDISAGLEAV